MSAADIPLGGIVRINLTGIVVGRSEFAEGPPSYLVQYERHGKVRREWMTSDKVEVERGAE